VLFQPELHEPLTETSWEEPWAREAIRRIVADADASFDLVGLWPAEDWDSYQATPPLKNLYVGAAGVLLGFDLLRRRGHAETAIDLAAASRRTLEVWRKRPDFEQWTDLPPHPEAAFFTGESGPALVAWRIEPSAELADDLLALVRANVGNEAVEIMWGVPGTMLAAHAMYEWTGEKRWADAWRESAESVLAMREDDGLWTNRLYGDTFRDALARLAVTEDGLANWPRREGADADQLQWCSGAPGILACTASYLDEELLLGGADLIWRAGPPGMKKGSGICHGTAGNGHAFLKVFERTGDELWLDRARRFAVHAVEQVERRGKGRYSLFTGDVGVALYVADCLEGRSAFPVIDSL
jgi:lantibiotic modifying enzyme